MSDGGSEVAHAPMEANAESELASIVEWLAILPDGSPEAEELATELAGELASFDPEVIAEFATSRLPPAGFLAILDRVAPDRLPGVIAATVAATADRAGLIALCQSAIDGAAARASGAAEILAPGNVVSTLLVALGTTGPSLSCLEAIAQAVRGSATGLEDALADIVFPSEITRILARLHAAGLGFGDAPALALVAGHVCGRLLAPMLGDVPAAAVLTAAGPLPAFLADLAAQLVAAGHQAQRLAAGGDDPDDPAVQRGDVLTGEVAVHLAFAAPTPADPLGTEPAIGVTAFGRALRRARASRPRDYDWAAVQALRTSDPDGYGELVLDERLIVVDLAASFAGIELDAG